MGRHTKEGYSEKALAALMKGQHNELARRATANYRQPSKVPSVTAPKNTVPATTTTKSGKHKYRSQASMNDASMMAETQKNLEMANTLMAAASKLSASAKQPKQQGKKHRIRSNDEIPTLNFSDINRRDIRKANEQKAQDQAAKELVMQLDFQREVADNPLVNPNAKPKQTAPINAVTEASKAKAEHDKEAQMRAMETASRSRNPYELSSEPTPVDPEDRPWYAVRKALGVPYEVSDRDTTYDRDLDEYYVSKSPKIRQMIKNKYHWSDEEFNSRYDDYQKDRGYNEALEDAATASITGREYPVGSSVYSAMMTPAVSAEGIYATVDGLINNDERSLTHDLHATMQKQAMRGATSEKVGEDFGDVGKFAYDAGMSLADQAVMTATGGKVGLGLMSGQIAGQGTNEALQRGIDPRKAALTGFAQGGVSLPLNLIGFDVALGKGINAGGNAVVKSLIQPTTGAIKGIGQAALSEGLEEIVEEGANKLTDVLINQDKSALLSDYSNYKAQGMSENDAWLQVAKDVGIDLAQAGLTGAAFGAVIRGYHEGASRVVPEIEAFAAEKLAEHEFNKNEDIRRRVKGELPVEEPRVPDVVENAQRQAEQARAEIERLNQQIPNPTGEVGEIPEDFDNEQSYEAWRQKLIEDARNKAENNAPVGESTPNPMQNVDFKPVIHNADGQLLDTVKVPEYSADNDVFFNGSDTDIAFAEAQDAAITDTFKNIVSDPEFNALSFKNGRQEVYVSPSTTGTGYRMSYTVDGVPTGHHDYSANEIDALSQNLREMAGNGGEDIRIQRKSDITSQTEAAPVNAEQPNINTETEQPDVAETQEPQEVNPYQFQGEELENAKKTYKKNRDTIRTLKQNIEVIEGDKSNYHSGKLKKDAKARIKAINDQIKSLETDNKPLYRGIHGKKQPVKELISRDDYKYIYDYRTQGSIEQNINYMVNYAGKTPEAVQMGKDLKKLVDNLVETGDLDLVRGIWDKAVELEDLARATDAEYTKSVAKHVTDAFGEERNTLAESIITSKAINHAFDALQKQKAELNNTGIDTNPKITEEVGETAPADIVETAPEPQEAPVNQVPEVVNREVTQPVNEVPTVTGDIGSVPPEPVEVTEGEDNRKTSKLAPHTLRRSDVVTEYEFENDPVVQNLLKYEAHNNETSLKSALENVKKNHDEILNNYLTKKQLIDSDKDVDQAMLLLQELSERMRAGDDSVRAQRNLLLARLRRQATKWGQNIQAFKKWNDTAEGALVNGTKITDQRTEEWESRNQEAKKKNEKIAEKLAEIQGTVEYDGTKISNGANYKPDTEVNPNKSNATLDRALRQQGYDGTMDVVKQPKTHEQLLSEVKNSIKKEYGSIADKFTDQDYEYLTNLVENKVDINTIIDEITHKLNHGEWYTIDESTPVKKEVSKRLSRILKNMGDDSRKAANNKVPEVEAYPEQIHNANVNKVRNTITDEMASLGLGTNTDIEFMAIMLDEGIPDWQIEDEIRHRLETGEWYSLDESIEPPSAGLNSKLLQSFNSLVDTGEVQQKPELTRAQIREQVKNTVEQEMASAGISRLYTDLGEFTDADIDYLTNMIMEGATTDEIAHALNTKLATGTFDISLETQRKVNELFDYASRFDPDSQEAVTAKAAAYKLIADEVVGKATAAERFEAWRYLAMLGNPKTMIRNFVGNMTFNVVTDVSNSLAGILEAGTDYAVRGGKAASNKLFGTDFDTSHGINRTKSLLLPTKADKALVKGAWGDSVSHRYNEVTGSKYDDTVQNKIRQQKSVFNSKWAQLYEKVTDAGISDTAAVRAKYSTSLAGYMKANGMDASAFEADEMFRSLEYLSRQRDLNEVERTTMEDLRSTHEALEKARDYAVEQAEYATFHEDNVVADILSNFSQKLRSSEKANAVTKGLGYILEGVMPFKKTPANIVKSGYEFSPFGGASSIAKTLRFITENTPNHKRNWGDTYTTKSGKVRERLNASDLIDSWSKTLTGTGMMVLGMYLRDKGILNSSNTDEKYQDELEGKQNYSITIGGHTYTIDWAAPASMTLLMGAELSKILEANAISSKDAYNNIGDVLGTVNSLIDPIVETSMMQGVKNTLESAANVTRNDDAGGGLGILGAMAANAGTNYLTQAIPTILGQAARVIDPTRRSTDTVIDNPFVAGIEKQGRKLMNKIPFVSYLNEPYVNARGEEELNSPSANPLVSIPYQFLSPGYLQEINPTEADISAREVYNAKIPRTVNINGKEKELDAFSVPQMDKGVFETWKSKVKVGDHKFTPEEMHEYRTVSGQANEEIRTELARSDWFNELSPQKQNDLLKSVNTFVDKLGKDALGYDQDDKALDIYKNGGKNAVPDLLEYYKEKAVSSQVTEQTGLSSSTNASKAIVEDAKAGDMQAVEQKIDAAAQITNYGYERPSYIVDTYYKAQKTFPQLTVDQFIQEFNAIAGQEGDKESVSQDEIINYANKKKMPLSEVQKYWTAYGKSNWKQVPYVMDDGTIGKHKQ